MADPTTRRCAIYTRKSSEEGLEQEYNSLDAQRDAAEAFICSQKHEGWKLLKEAYDDGGISGGHMERPSLQRLIRDIKAGKIDVVVVYKVDRLSRSLADFAQLMQLFDKLGVSFVSVTQQFNTSSSMGRLTLNVLLSFAQFEREVTGERIRDKIALSKKKGMWMGGIPPLGYDIVERKLIVNTTEAQVVVDCYETYLRGRGLIETVLDLNRRGLRTKSFVSVKGRVQEPKPWIAKQLHRILTQPVYRGLIRHKDQHFDGEHAAIIDLELWEKVQNKLRENAPEFRKMDGHDNEIATGKTRLLHPLKGFVHSNDGYALTPTYTNKSGKKSDGTKSRKRYRYYVSQHAIQQGYGATSIKTLNAGLLEDTVRQLLARALPELVSAVSSADLTNEQIRCRVENYAAKISGMDSLFEFTETIRQLSPKIVVGPDMVQIHISRKTLGDFVAHPVGPAVARSLTNPIKVKIVIEAEEVVISSCVKLSCRRGRAQIVNAGTGDLIAVKTTEPKPALIQTLVQAEFWRAELMKYPAKSLVEVLQPHGVQPAYIRRLLNAAYLAPDIKKSVFQGTQPAEIQVQDLIKPRSMDWEIQRRELGYSPAGESAVQ